MPSVPAMGWGTTSDASPNCFCGPRSGPGPPHRWEHEACTTSPGRRAWDFLGSGGQARTVSQGDITTVSGPQLTMSFEVAAEQHADFDARTVRAVHQTDLPG